MSQHFADLRDQNESVGATVYILRKTMDDIQKMAAQENLFPSNFRIDHAPYHSFSFCSDIFLPQPRALQKFAIFEKLILIAKIAIIYELCHQMSNLITSRRYRTIFKA